MNYRKLKTTATLFAFISILTVHGVYASSCFSDRLAAGLKTAWQSFKIDVSDDWQRGINSLLFRGAGGLILKTAKLAYFSANQSLHVAFAPPSVIYQTLKSTYLVNRAISRGETNRFRYLFIPMDVAVRKSPHVIAYAALAVAGVNVPFELEKKKVYKDDFDKVRPVNIPLGKDEIVVFITTPDDSDSDEFMRSMRIAYITQGQGDRIYNIQEDDPKVIFQKLGELRTQGRIKDIHWFGHGSPGELDMKSAGLNDISSPKKLWKKLWSGDKSGEVSQATLPELQKIADRWPNDLFAPDARITLYSCDVAKGEKGDQFLKGLGAITFQNGGTLFASSKSVGESARGELKEGFLPDKLSSNALTNLAMVHSLAVPMLYYLEGGRVGLARNLLDGTYTETPLKTYAFPRPQPEPAPDQP